MSLLNKLALIGVESSLFTLLATTIVETPGEDQVVANTQKNRSPKTEQPAAPISVQAWRAKFKESCLAPNEIPNTDIEKNIALIARLVRKSPFGNSVYQKAAAHNFVFCDLKIFENVANTTTGLNIDRLRATGHSLALNEPGVNARQLRTAVHEWRHSWQGMETAFSNRGGLAHPYPDAVAKSWMREADASAVTVLFAWDMSRRGYPQIWHSALEDVTYGPMAKAFQAALPRIPADKITNKDLPKAMRAAFHAWLDDDFLAHSYYEQATAKFKDQGVPFAPTAQDVIKLGEMPGQASLSYLEPQDWDRARNQAQKMYQEVHKTPKPTAPQPYGPKP